MEPWLLLICCAFTLKTSLSSVLQQSPGTLQVSVGETITLECIHEIEVKYCFSTTTWHKVNKRTGQLVEVIEQGTLNMQEMKNTKICKLTITEATLQDSGMYYCTGTYNLMVLIGNGTSVIVTDPGPLNPSIIMYSPSDMSGPVVPLQCLVMGAVPSQVQVHWMIDHSERSGWTESSWIENNDTTLECTRAHITLSEEEWTQAAQIECIVQHDGTNISATLEPWGVCSWMLYLSCGVAFLTITVAVTVAVCSHKERLKDAAGDCDRITEDKEQGLQDSFTSWTVVEYSCLYTDSVPPDSH